MHFLVFHLRTSLFCRYNTVPTLLISNDVTFNKVTSIYKDMKNLFYFVPPQNVVIAIGCCGVFTWSLMGDLGFFTAFLVGSVFFLLAAVNPLRTFISKPLTQHAFALIGIKELIPELKDDLIARTIDFSMRNPHTVQYPLSQGEPVQLVAFNNLIRAATKYGPHGEHVIKKIEKLKKKLGYTTEEEQA